MSISVAIICRNSSDVIERCLESVKDADEIVIVDTGSTDNTKEIASKYTSKIYDYWGCNENGKKDGLFANFADARNKAIEYCTCTHILTIDTDEVLNGKMDEMKNFSGVSMSVKCISADTGEAHIQPRIYKRDPKIFWQGAAHNYLNCPDGEMSNNTITFYNNKQKQRDQDRTMRILEKWIKDHPNNCTRELFYLSKEYYKREWHKRAIKTIETYLSMSKFPEEKADALMILARCYARLNNKTEAMNACLTALTINPMFEEALRIAGKLSNPINRLKWKHLASFANNSGVLFVRPNKPKITILANEPIPELPKTSKYDIEIITPQLLNAVGADVVEHRLKSSQNYAIGKPIGNIQAITKKELINKLKNI